mmetsp:Transcript_48728/g.128766  ORF Transcript_48728/g.128766 Transcript_48728/m.128766 type:complete len:151 (+) Transcript_48728:38-490(+)|eukprot:CAMPEP_0113691264 /NCGR_PEP_ID=MMETSP0038_2-20120614/18320_1 /TAXON_ID=2898 /ORGANISM="Cryptomonas paramecium" /LENGTH=150 /DNA_ID=CAMNT_0000612821 /DNA_START=44 /DNA_END=496 /DNA_ORIENTATION=- /assembly_acc=CAM_ASM_000170
MPPAATAGAEEPKKRSFRKFQYRGIELEALLDLPAKELVALFPARIRRRFKRGLPRKYTALLTKLRKAKKEAPMHEKPDVIKTHLRDMVIMPEMIGSMVGVYNGKTFTAVEIKAEMIGTYLAEYSMTYKPIKHGRPGIGATASSKFVPLK